MVEVTSEEKEHPDESALISGNMRGLACRRFWHSNDPPVFDEPQRLRCISLVFEENETARTQEFVLRWSPDGGNSFKEIVRQQWNFSPPQSTREIEEYQLELSGVFFTAHPAEV